MPSQNLFFIRGTATSDPLTCFETWTDVWIFGDVRGFGYARSMVLNAKGAQKAIRLDAIPHESHSMRVLILPAVREAPPRPRVRIIERLIRDRLNMELIVYGNPAGYDRLAAVFQRAIDSPGDPSDHEHVDDSPVRGRWLLPRSMSLTVRRPLITWDLARLGTFKTLVIDKQVTFLPDPRLIPLTPDRYEPFSATDCLRLRLT